MAWTRISAHEVDRICEKYEKMIDDLVKQRMQQRKDRLMKRFLFPLSDADANVKAFWNEKNKIKNNIIYEQEYDYEIYKSLKEICKVTRAGDFIQIDAEEATFINKLRK